MTKFYAIITRDKPGATVTRMARLKEHLAHVEASIDQFAIAGAVQRLSTGTSLAPQKRQRLEEAE